MTAKKNDGTEIFRQERIYMPVPQKLGTGTTMGRGPYEKTGMVEDAGLPVGRTVHERFDVIVADEDGIVPDEVKVDVKLWYLPFGTKDSDPFLWRDVSKTLSFGGNP